ncbi:MAG TPA: VIT family protein [Steroidobacteraceae bacterium]|nr:VIT family protein [Steroidobacteraceae bacterium]
MKHHSEFHRIERVGWLRASVLGANDGLISTASLLMGVSAAQLGTSTILMTGVAGLVGGALSMGAGEYVSVSSQADSEGADLARERKELAETPEAEHRELVGIYVQRGMSRELAERVATEMASHDLLATHAREELGITDLTRARPGLAAVASMLSFAAGALPPVLIAVLVPAAQRSVVLFATSLLLLMLLGVVGARLGGAPGSRAALRVGFWGVVAMGVTALAGRIFGVNLTG